MTTHIGSILNEMICTDCFEEIYLCFFFYRQANLAPNICCLFEWSNWLTPTFHKKRFFTRFYFSKLSEPVQQFECDFEMDASDWFAPTKALSDFQANRITLQIPQIYELSRIRM